MQNETNLRSNFLIKMKYWLKLRLLKAIKHHLVEFLCSMFEGLLLPWQQIYHLAFNSIFRKTPAVSSKLYFFEISQVSEKLWLFNHKRADFFASRFGDFFTSQPP